MASLRRRLRKIVEDLTFIAWGVALLAYALWHELIHREEES